MGIGEKLWRFGSVPFGRPTSGSHPRRVTPQLFGAENRFRLELAPDDMNKHRPAHGLDQRSLVSSSNVPINTPSDSALAPLGRQSNLAFAPAPAAAFGLQPPAFYQQHQHLHLPFPATSASIPNQSVDETEMEDYLASRFPYLPRFRLRGVTQSLVWENETASTTFNVAPAPRANFGAATPTDGWVNPYWRMSQG